MINKQELVSGCTGDWRAKIAAYVDGECDAGAMATIRDHLRGCAECRAEARQLTAINEALARHSAERAPRDLWDGVATRMDASAAEPFPPTPSRRTVGRWIGSAAVGASFTLAALGTLWLTFAPPKSVVNASVQDFVTNRASGWTVDYSTQDVGALSRWAQDRVSFAVPDLKERLGAFEVGGVRLCWLLDRRLLGITYRNGESRALLYVMTANGLALPSAERRLASGALASIHHHQGHGVAVWSESGLVFVLVAAEKDFEGALGDAGVGALSGQARAMLLSLQSSVRA